MRTTLELDDEVVTAARRLARQKGTTLGQVISELARRSLHADGPPKIRNGFQVFPAEPGEFKVDLRKVNELRDES